MQLTSSRRPSPAAVTAAAGVLGSSAVLNALRARLEKPRVKAGANPTAAAVLARMPIIQQPYSPPFWAVNTWVQARPPPGAVLSRTRGHGNLRTHAIPSRSAAAQLALHEFRRARMPQLPFRREVLTMPDGGEARSASGQGSLLLLTRAVKAGSLTVG